MRCPCSDHVLARLAAWPASNDTSSYALAVGTVQFVIPVYLMHQPRAVQDLVCNIPALVIKTIGCEWSCALAVQQRMVSHCTPLCKWPARIASKSQQLFKCLAGRN